MKMSFKYKIYLLAIFFLGLLNLFFSQTNPAMAECPDAISALWTLDETTPGTYLDIINSNDGVGNLNPTPSAGQVDGGQLFNSTGTTGIDVPANPYINWGSNDSSQRSEAGA